MATGWSCLDGGLKLGCLEITSSRTRRFNTPRSVGNAQAFWRCIEMTIS